MFTKTLTAGVLAASMALTSLTPSAASAEISGDDALVGFLSLLFIGAAIHSSRDNDNDRTARPAPDRSHGWRVLPANCVRDVTRRNGGTVRIFGQRCLTNTYSHNNRLPQACHVLGRNQNGQRIQGYSARCLRDAGFRTTRH